MTNVETELRKMQGALMAAGVKNGAKVCELAADIVSASSQLVLAVGRIDHNIRFEDELWDAYRRVDDLLSTPKRATLSDQPNAEITCGEEKSI